MSLYTIKFTVNLNKTFVFILKSSRVTRFERATVPMLQSEPRECGLVPARPHGSRTKGCSSDRDHL